MNTALTVKLTGDSNYIPVMYRVIEMTVGTDAASTYCALQVVRVGWDTEVNYNNWKSGRYYDESTGMTHATGRETTGMQGAMGDLSVAALSTIEPYKRQTPSMDQ